MEPTDLSVETVPCAAPLPTSAVVMCVLSRLQALCGTPGGGPATPGLLTYGSFKAVPSASEAMEILPLCPWELLPLSDSLARATQVTRTSGELVILCFANFSWRLLIASKIVSMPSFEDGGSFGSLIPTSTLVLQAKLFVQLHGQVEPNSPAIRAWHAQVPAQDDAAISLFLCTALQYALPIIVESPVQSLSDALHDAQGCSRWEPGMEFWEDL